MLCSNCFLETFKRGGGKACLVVADDNHFESIPRIFKCFCGHDVMSCLEHGAREKEELQNGKKKRKEK